MARPRKDGASPSIPLPPALASWAEAIGDAIGRGMMRALNTGTPLGNGNGAAAPARRRGRPPKVVSASGGAVPMDRRCTAQGCDREARSKGLCSAHYQAERRRLLSSGKPA